MATNQLGSDVTIGAGTDVHGEALTVTNYYVASIKSGNKELRTEEIFDGDGQPTTIIVFTAMETATLELISKGAARTETNIKSDFPVGGACAILGTNTWLVLSLDIDKTQGAWKVTSSVKKIGITLT